MIEVLATNITSPLGMTTEENYQCVRAGGTLLATYEHWKGLADAFGASMFTAAQKEKLALEGCTSFEAMAIHSIAEALTHAGDMDLERTVLILSTTKCNVDELAAEAEKDGAYLHPGETARKIARHFSITAEPIVVCNACISGVTGQVLAKRLIEAGVYDQAIVCGADSVSAFIVAGFQSFKALSPYPCRPFDIERLGLNVGEAAATMIFGKASETAPASETDAERWLLQAGCTNNDAYHVSAPSPVGEGTYRAIMTTLDGVNIDDLATVCVHGTATMFNDQMESKAIQQAGLSEVPLTAIKGYYGHTMGAAGLLETVLTMRALDEGIILPALGFEEIGVSGKVCISSQEKKTEKQSFLKIISGFGGCNGALYYNKEKRQNTLVSENEERRKSVANGFLSYKIQHRVHITPEGVEVDGRPLPTTATGKALLTEIYKKYVGNYPKFYKMDLLCRLAFVASELLLMQEEKAGETGASEIKGEERGIVLFNRTTSIDSDRKHIATLVEDNLPSPSIFLYTLPNIMTGEIAIKHQMKGETSLYILADKREGLMEQIVATTLAQSELQSVVTGWVDCQDEEHFEADLLLAGR